MSAEEKIGVVLVDDHAVVRSGLEQLLATAPDVELVASATNGQEALDRAADDPQGAVRQLDRARSLRHALYAACTDATDDAAWEAVAVEGRAAASQAVLSRGNAPGHRWSIAPDAGLERPVLELAREAADLLARTDMRRVKACPGSHCGWLFLDPSGRRRWCSMEVCGNRAKARRHAERRRASGRSGRKGG